MSVNDILICGVGGQGTVLASRLIASAYLSKDAFVRTAETIGMAQRGGCVVSHVRVDSEEKSSIIPFKTADLLIAFEPAEAVRCFSRLKDDAPVIVNSQTVMPVTASLGGVSYDNEGIFNSIKSRKNAIIINASEIAEKAGSPKAVNVVLLGAAVGAGFIDITIDELKRALENMLPKKLHEINFKALELGYKEVN